jgi:hypothetical protein
MREDNMMPTLTCTTFRKHLLTALSLVGLSMAATDSLAHDTPILGGTGGGRFEAPYPASSALVGFSLRSGKDLDHITLLCAAVHANATTGTSKEVGSFGGKAGSVQKTSCPPNTVVTSMVVARSRVSMVNYIEVSCSELVTGKPVPHCRFRHAAGLNDREKNLKVAESQTPADMIFRHGLRHNGFL